MPFFLDFRNYRRSRWSDRILVRANTYEVAVFPVEVDHFSRVCTTYEMANLPERGELCKKWTWNRNGSVGNTTHTNNKPYQTLSNDEKRVVIVSQLDVGSEDLSCSCCDEDRANGDEDEIREESGFGRSTMDTALVDETQDCEDDNPRSNGPACSDTLNACGFRPKWKPEIEMSQGVCLG